jgi:hypothetical protein
MLCCAMGVAAVATGAIGWRRFRRVLYGRLAARSALGVAAAVMIAMAGGLTLVHHFDHAAHAADNGLPAGPLPLCGGSSTDNKSIEE